MKDKMTKDKIELKKYYSTKEFLENYIYDGSRMFRRRNGIPPVVTTGRMR